MHHKTARLIDLRVGQKQGLAEGQFSGYASVFANVDLHGDITVKGAFAESLKAWESSDNHIPVLYGHRDDDPDYNIGHVISAKEDDRGLLVTAQLDLESPKGAQAYRLVKGRRLSEMSFAYEVQDSAEVKTAEGKRATELRKLKLFEVSLVPRGANPETEIVAVKAAPRTDIDTLALRLRIADLTDLTEGTNMNILEKRAATVDKINAIRSKAAEDATTGDTAGVSFSEEQITELHALVDNLDKLDALIEKAKSNAPLLAKLEGMGGVRSMRPDHGSLDGGPRYSETKSVGRGYMDVSTKSFGALADRVAPGMCSDNAYGQKALLPAGSTAVSVTVRPEIATTAKPMSELLAALPVVTQSSPVFRYLRQTARTNNAAVVAAGAAKPTSVYGLTPIEGELQVIAHLSEAIDKYALADVGNLQRFVADELLYGLHRALEQQVLNGTGTGQLTGLLQTGGIQTQAFATDLITTTRQAVTKIENIGHTAGTFVLSPADWETLELARTDTAGSLELGGPVDRAKRTLWGVPIAICNALPAKTALLLDPSAVAIDTDAKVEVLWSDNVGDDFSKNQLRARCESRYHVSVYQPLGVVKLTTAAA